MLTGLATKHATLFNLNVHVQSILLDVYVFVELRQGPLVADL